jgi:hypothetical protein
LTATDPVTQYGESAAVTSRLVTLPPESVVVHACAPARLRRVNDLEETVLDGGGVQEAVADGSAITASVGELATVSVGELATVSVGKLVTVSVGELVTVSLGKLVTVSVGELVTVSVGKLVTVSVGELVTVSVGKLVTVSVGKLVTVSAGGPVIAPADLLPITRAGAASGNRDRDSARMTPRVPLVFTD